METLARVLQTRTISLILILPQFDNSNYIQNSQQKLHLKYQITEFWIRGFYKHT